MRSNRTIFFSLIALPGIVLAQSGVDLLNFATPTAQILAGANVTAATGSAFGKFVVSQLTASGGGGLQTFISETGIDPRTDISDVLFSSSGPSEGAAQWLIAAHGSFGLAISQLEANLEQQGATITKLPGVDLIQQPDAGGTNPKASPACIALYTDGGTALVGDCGAVQASIQSNGATAPTNPNLFAEARKLRAAQDVWVTSVVPLTQFHAGLPNELNGVFQTNLFQSIQQISGGVKFASTAQGALLQISGQALTDTPKDATSLLNVLQFLTSMIGTQTGGLPQGSLIASILGSLQASTSGNALDVSLTIPETALEELIESGRSSSKAVAVAGRR